MNPYLARLKSKKGLPDQVPKVPKVPFGTFGTAPSRAFSRNGADDGCPPDEQSGGAFCPWGPRVTPEMLDAWRCELRALVAELATAEGWSNNYRDRLQSFIERQPGLATLRDDIRSFRERLAAARAAAEQEAARRRAQAWRCAGLDARHYCPGCDGGCVGTARSCIRRDGGKL
jgi:hypothetical protein